MTTPDDAALVRRVAERMGLSHIIERDGMGSGYCLTCLWDAATCREDSVCSGAFNPLNDWADFGAVWEWAEQESWSPPGFVGGLFVEGMVEHGLRRALLLAIDRAGGGE